MVQVVDDLPKNLKIAFSGRSLGNLDKRFSGSVDENQEKLFSSLGLISEQVTIMDAKGGDGIVDLSKTKSKSNVVTADALVTTSTEQGLAIFPADCIPLVIYSSKPQCLALVHFGWRNIKTDFLDKVISYLKQTYKIDPKLCFAYMGPSIHKNSYFFPKIQQSQLQETKWRKNISKIDGMYHVDLIGYLHDGLAHQGFKLSKILKADYDIGDDKDFFSNFRHNKYGSPAGRNGFIVKLKR